MSQIRLHCVHRNRLFRELLSEFLPSDKFAFKEIEFRDRDIGLFAAQQPSVLLIELGLPQRRTVEIVRGFREHPQNKVVLLVPGVEQDPYEQQLMLDCVELGIDGYILEESPLDEVIVALTRVSQGSVFCPNGLMKPLMDQLATLSRESRLRRQFRPSTLTQRELEILQWIAEGLSNKLVAKKLSLSIYTVKNHVHRILKKLGAQDRFEAVHHAVEHRLLAGTPPSLRSRP